MWAAGVDYWGAGFHKVPWAPTTYVLVEDIGFRNSQIWDQISGPTH